MKPTPTQLEGLRAIKELRGVKVYVARDLRRFVSARRAYDKPVKLPTWRTIKSLLTNGWVENDELFISRAGSAYENYRITPAGKAVLEEYAYRPV